MESVSVTYPDAPKKRPPPWAPRDAFGRVKLQRGAGRGVQRVQKASAYFRNFVVEDVAAVEVGRSADVGPTALHAKVCNQSRNVPAGRWKKAPEGSNASTNKLRVKTAQSVGVQRGAGRRLQRVQMRAPTVPCV